jgi:hypothetical protein
VKYYVICELCDTRTGECSDGPELPRLGRHRHIENCIKGLSARITHCDEHHADAESIKDECFKDEY